MIRASDDLARKKRTRSNQSGFSLIELLIVIVVLGILAATVVFAISGVNADSARAACNSDAKTVEQAVVAFRDNPGNSVSVDQYPALGTSGQTELTAPASSNFGGPYLRSWPNNPNHYTITLDANTRGQVDVTPAGSSTPLNFDGAADPCSIVS